MKKKAMLLAMLTMGMLSAMAQQKFDAQIFVSDFNEKGISNAEVKLTDTTGVFKFGGKTNGEGKCLIPISTGSYHIQLIQDGELKKESIIHLPELEGNRMYNDVRIHLLYEERTSFALEDLHFKFNSAIISEDSYHILDRLVEYLGNEVNGKFEIAGHTDNVGSDEDNQLLSENRATAVKAYLVAHGIEGSRLIAKGYGESVPIADNTTEEGRAINRRTEVRLME